MANQSNIDPTEHILRPVGAYLDAQRSKILSVDIK